MEFILDRCEICDGIWLYEGKLEGLLRRAARGPLEPSLVDVFP